MTGLFANLILVASGIVSVAGAIILLVHRNPVRAALGLLMSLVGVGFMFLTIGAHFVGFVQLMIYAGAIVVLFLFAVMHFPLGKLRRDRIPGTRLLGWALVIVLFAILLIDLSALARSGALNSMIAPRQFDDALQIGRRLVSDWIYPFELIGVLLLVAVVAVMHLTRPDSTSPDAKEDRK